MKNIIIKIITKLIKPFYGSGIGRYPPFFQINNFYKKISNGKSSIHNTNYGFKMFLDGSKFIDKEIIFNGYWEKNITNLFLKYLKEGDIFLDIGANIGYFSLLSSKILGDKGKVISFEPSTLNYYALEKNIKLNNFNNIQTHKLGVGHEENQFEIYYNNDNPGATSLIKNDENIKYEKEIINIIKLDNFIIDHKIDFIKMDIEGFEYEAMLGMENILKSNNLKMIFEYSPKIYKNKEQNYEEYSINLLNYLNHLGFKLFEIENDGNILKIENNKDFFHKVFTNHIGQADIFCIK